MSNIFLIYTIPFVTLFLIFGLIYIDSKKKREKIITPIISFIMPCFNDEKDLKEAVQSIYKSYDKFELFIVNDKSTDNSLEVLHQLKKRYNFHLINNKENLGKTQSINQTVPQTKGDIIFIIDSDTVLTKKAVRSILKRFAYDEKVAAVSCPYEPKSKGILARMQEIEYNQIRALKTAQNNFSVLGAWGGCVAVKRNPFLEVGMFSENMLTEDLELALKLYEKGYRVEQSEIQVKSDVPITIKHWFRQKIRWNSGGAQCFLTHKEAYLKNPLVLIFGFGQILLIATLIFFFYKYLFSFYTIAHTFLSITHPINTFIAMMEYIYVVDKLIIMHTIFIKLGFVLFSLPYGIMQIHSWKDSYKIIYLAPYSLIYAQFFLVTYVLGWIVGTRKYFKLKRGGRAW